MARLIVATAILAGACGPSNSVAESGNAPRAFLTAEHSQAVYGVARGVGTISPSVTPTVEQPTAVPEPWEFLTHATVTHYGVSYRGLPMACGGTYWSHEPAIIAVGPAWYSALPCGTPLRITGPFGVLEATRSDSCPGCGPALFDLSEAGQALVCGSVGNNCGVLVEVKR